MDTLFRNTLGPLGWTAALLVPPAIFALYFLRLKRQPVQVPSTYLWTKVIEDLHVNSLWQRLRQSLLLFLQLSLAFLAILALLRPGWQGESLVGQKFVFLIDNSASMSTQDAESKTRLAAAKDHVGSLIDQMRSDMSAMIISFAGHPDVVQEFTSNRRLLREALERIKPTAEPTQIRGALELADGLANPGRVTIQEGGTEVDANAVEPIELYIFSDGLFEPVDGFSLGNLRPKFLPFGKMGAENLAITAMSTLRGEMRPEQRQAFVQAANFSDKPQQATIELYLDKRLIDAAQIEVPAGDVAGVTFDLGDAASGVLESKIDAPGGFTDMLPIDNRAYAVLDEEREAHVLLATPGNSWVERALATERARRLAKVETIKPSALADPAMRRQLQTEQYDLAIFDQCAPDESPAANTLYIGRLPPGPTWRTEASTERVVAPQIIDWQRGHPLLNLVELGNVQLYDSLALTPPSGGQALIDSTKGILMAIAPRDGYEDAVIGFEIVGLDKEENTTVNTNWPIRPSFPNFFLNVLEYLAGGALDVQPTNQPGRPVEAPLRQAKGQISVRLPDGTLRSAGAFDGGTLVWSETDQLGIYAVLAEDRTVGRFAVNLFDPAESDVRLRPRQDRDGAIEAVDAVSIGYVDVEAEALRSPVRKELWRALLLAALAVLVLEWYIYNRRVYI